MFDMDKLFKADFTELTNNIELGIPLFCAFAYIEGTEYKQEIYKKFMPLSMSSEMYANVSSKYTYKQFTNWHNEFEYVKQNGTNVLYNFGKLSSFKEEFLPKVKEYDINDAEY